MALLRSAPAGGEAAAVFNTAYASFRAVLEARRVAEDERLMRATSEDAPTPFVADREFALALPASSGALLRARTPPRPASPVAATTPSPSSAEGLAVAFRADAQRRELDDLARQVMLEEARLEDEGADFPVLLDALGLHVRVLAALERTPDLRARVPAELMDRIADTAASALRAVEAAADELGFGLPPAATSFGYVLPGPFLPLSSLRACPGAHPCQRLVTEKVLVTRKPSISMLSLTDPVASSSPLRWTRARVSLTRHFDPEGCSSHPSTHPTPEVLATGLVRAAPSTKNYSRVVRADTRFGARGPRCLRETDVVQE